MDIDFEQTESKPKKKNKKAKRLKLSKNELDSEDFKKYWFKWSNSKEFEFTLESDLDSKDDLIDIFEEKNIFCMASNENDGDLKFYFYCQEKIKQNWFLMEINIVDGDEFSLELKFDQDEDSAGEILNLVDKLLKENSLLA